MITFYQRQRPHCIPCWRIRRRRRLFGVAALAIVLGLLFRGLLTPAGAEDAPTPEMSPAEAAAFQAGRETAYADMAGIVDAAYQQGLKDGSSCATATEVRP